MGYLSYIAELFAVATILQNTAGQMLISHNNGVIVSASSQIGGDSRFDVEHVVDGNADTNADGCNCCASTNYQHNPWFKIDLIQEYMIQRIHVIGRTDYHHPLYKMEIQLSITDSDATILQGVDTSDTNINTLNFTLTSSEPARYITLTLRNLTHYFIICELYVYAVCSDGRYGSTCNEECGYCYNNDTCDKLNGNCPSECSAGNQGDTCKQVCNPGTYGINCLHTCGTCENNAACNNVDGECTACSTGYLSPMCKECVDGRHGTTCNGTCGQCNNSDACDKTNVSCPNGCSAGFQGTTCKEECNDGTFGLGCEEKCGNCFNNGPCNKVDGSCALCAAGYKGNTCLSECQGGTFGFNCKQRCGMCLNVDMCDIYTGECPNGCTYEYKGSQCLQVIAQDSDTWFSLLVFIGLLFAVVVINTTFVLVCMWLCCRKRMNKKIHRTANNEDTSIPLPNTSSNCDILRFENRDGESTYTELNRNT